MNFHYKASLATLYAVIVFVLIVFMTFFMQVIDEKPPELTAEQYLDKFCQETHGVDAIAVGHNDVIHCQLTNGKPIRPRSK